MKKITLTFAIVVMTAISITAQERTENKKSPEERTEKIIVKMRTELSLSDDQVSKLKPVLLKREQQRDEFRAKMADTRSKQRQFAKEETEEFKKILTPEQQERWRQQRKTMHEKHQKNRGEVNHDLKEKE